MWSGCVICNWSRNRSTRPEIMRFSPTGNARFSQSPWHGRKQGSKIRCRSDSHAIGQGAARRWHVFDNLDLESGNAPAFNFGKGRAVTPVDQSGRQMPQQINKLRPVNFSSVTPSFGPMPGKVVASAKRGVKISGRIFASCRPALFVRADFFPRPNDDSGRNSLYNTTI